VANIPPGVTVARLLRMPTGEQVAALDAVHEERVYLASSPRLAGRPARLPAVLEEASARRGKGRSCLRVWARGLFVAAAPDWLLLLDGFILTRHGLPVTGVAGVVVSVAVGVSLPPSAWQRRRAADRRL
jgi:hypothetical protein